VAISSVILNAEWMAMTENQSQNCKSAR